MIPQHATSNFMYFIENHSAEQLEALLTELGNHLKEKFRSKVSQHDGNTSKTFFWFWFQLSEGNKETAAKWINSNYSAWTPAKAWYEKERDELLALPDDHTALPSKAFIEEFMNRLPNEEDIPEEFLGRDAEDYRSWNYALYGDYESDAENEIHTLKIWEWQAVYEALEAQDATRLKEAIEELEL